MGSSPACFAPMAEKCSFKMSVFSRSDNQRSRGVVTGCFFIRFQQDLQSLTWPNRSEQHFNLLTSSVTRFLKPRYWDQSSSFLVFRAFSRVLYGRFNRWSICGVTQERDSSVRACHNAIEYSNPCPITVIRIIKSRTHRRWGVFHITNIFLLSD